MNQETRNLLKKMQKNQGDFILRRISAKNTHGDKRFDKYNLNGIKAIYDGEEIPDYVLAELVENNFIEFTSKAIVVNFHYYLTEKGLSISL